MAEGRRAVRPGLQVSGGRLPDFLIIGAMRAGTTSLARYLGSHPGVFMPAKKELHFFDWNVDRGLDCGVRIECGEPLAEACNRARVGEVRFRDHDAIGQDHLLARFRRPFERAEAADGVDHGHDNLDKKFAAEGAIGRERRQHRPGVGKPARFDDDARERRHLATLALGDQTPQRQFQVGARGAAQTAVAEQRDLIGGAAH